MITNANRLRPKRLAQVLFLFFGAIYFIGSAFDFPYLYLISNVVLIPMALVYYAFKTNTIFWPVVGALLFLYIRDLFLVFGFFRNPWIILVSFYSCLIILFLCVFTAFQRSKIHLVEIISLVIMYGFLGFLAYYVGEMVPDVIPFFSRATFISLLLLILLVALAFTRYLLKSHWASLWFMVGTAALLVSELAYFFKMYIISDISVRLFFPGFHILAVYAFIQFGINRRKTANLPYF